MKSAFTLTFLGYCIPFFIVMALSSDERNYRDTHPCCNSLAESSSPWLLKLTCTTQYYKRTL